MADTAKNQLGDPAALKEAFGRVVARRRFEARLAQRPFSLMAGLGNTHLRSIERGEVAPSIVTVMKLAEALDLSPGALLDEAYEEALHSQQAK